MKYLVVVDMQKDFISGSLGSQEAEKIVPAVCEKILEYKKSGGKIFVTMDTHNENYLSTSEGKNLPVEHCIKGTEGWELDERIKQAVGDDCEIFEKITFGSKELAEKFFSIIKPDDTIELCGLCTDICVVSNALLIKAFCPETTISVNSNCCAGVTPEKHQAALETMASCQIKIEE